VQSSIETGLTLDQVIYINITSAVFYGKVFSKWFSVGLYGLKGPYKSSIVISAQLAVQICEPCIHTIIVVLVGKTLKSHNNSRHVGYCYIKAKCRRSHKRKNKNVLTFAI
jgi:hypothetical protein